MPYENIGINSKSNTMKKVRYCRHCEEREVLSGRKFCLQCINFFEREKKKLRREKLKQRLVIKKEKKKTKKENSLSRLKRKLDFVFSQWIRQRDKGICFTCGDKKDWQKQQCGHYIRRSNMSLRWDEINCHCQCVRCNIFMSGNYPAYSESLINKYGVEIISKLNRQGKEIKKWTADELKEMTKKYS